MFGLSDRKRVQYSKVFVPGGLPDFTYIAREELRLEERLRGSKDNLCKLVAVTGQTKSGKTVLARKVFPKDDAIWIDGGGVLSEEDLWQVILRQVNLPTSTTKQTSTGSASTLGTGGESEVNLLVVKGKGDVSGSRTANRSSSETETTTVGPRVAAIRGLTERQLPVVIDDFHYIKRELQGSIVRALKGPIFDGLPVILIAIPHRRFDAMKVEREMTGRIEFVNVPVWEEKDLEAIAQTGFDLLNATLDSASMSGMAKQAIGSPHLMQEFCREVCRLTKIEETLSTPQSKSIGPQLEGVFTKVADNTGRTMFEKVARGPRSRTDRKMRQLKAGGEADIYRVVLLALASLHPGLTTIEYEDLRAAIRDILSDSTPQAHEVSRVLKHMSSISASDEASTPVVDYEEAERRLHITDPFFAYFLRWGNLRA
jgi:hypothetical protein